MKTENLKIYNTIAYILLILTNALAEIIPIGNNTTGEISKQYTNLFTPMPFTFAIWGLIYLGLGVFCVYQWGCYGNKKIAVKGRKSIGFLFVITCFFNISWIFLWHYDMIGLSVIAIVGLLITLIIAYKKIPENEGDLAYTLSLKVPFDIYFGWIIAAVIANISTFLIKTFPSGIWPGDVFWTVAVTVIATVISLLLIIKKGKILSALSVCWAFFGIVVRHLSSDGFNGKYPTVYVALIIAIITIIVVSALKIKTDNRIILSL